MDFHVTGYHARQSRKTRSGEITVDGEPVLRLSYDRFVRESDGWFAVTHEDGREAVPTRNFSDETAWCPDHHDEIHPPQQLGDAMRAYLAMPIRLALKSPNPFIRSLAIIDRRVGRRTLKELEIGNGDHSLVQDLYRLRMDAIRSKP